MPSAHKGSRNSQNSLSVGLPVFCTVFLFGQVFVIALKRNVFICFVLYRFPAGLLFIRRVYQTNASGYLFKFYFNDKLLFRERDRAGLFLLC